MSTKKFQFAVRDILSDDAVKECHVEDTNGRDLGTFSVKRMPVNSYKYRARLRTRFNKLPEAVATRLNGESEEDIEFSRHYEISEFVRDYITDSRLPAAPGCDVEYKHDPEIVIEYLMAPNHDMIYNRLQNFAAADDNYRAQKEEEAKND